MISLDFNALYLWLLIRKRDELRLVEIIVKKSLIWDLTNWWDCSCSSNQLRRTCERSIADLRLKYRLVVDMSGNVVNLHFIA